MRPPLTCLIGKRSSKLQINAIRGAIAPPTRHLPTLFLAARGPPSMSQALRQALYMARSALACASRECLTNPAASAVQLEPRALTRLLSFRGFRQQSWAAQSAAAAPTGQQQTAPPPPSPWTPTRELKKRKILPKRMQHLLTVSITLLLLVLGDRWIFVCAEEDRAAAAAADEA